MGSHIYKHTAQQKKNEKQMINHPKEKHKTDENP